MATERTVRYAVPGEFLVLRKRPGLPKLNAGTTDNEEDATLNRSADNPVYVLRTIPGSVTAKDLADKLNVTVLPNFFITPQHGHSIGGGPAGPPDPWGENIVKALDAADIDGLHTRLKFTIGEGARTLKERRPTSARIPVKVYVLDTAPEIPFTGDNKLDYIPDFFAMDALQAGFEGWNQVKGKGKDEDKGKLTVARISGKAHALSTEHMCGANCALHAHGLFIASAIRMIAPNVEVAIIPIFNAKGIGTLATLIDGLEAVRDDPFTGIKIVNCSFTVYVPADEEQEQADKLQAKGKGYGGPSAEEVTQRENLRKKLQDSFKRFRRFIAGEDDDLSDDIEAIYNDLFFVAAAGNDGDTPNLPIPPGRRWPARFGDVLAVTAHDGTARAAYGNSLTPKRKPGDQPGFAVTGKISSIYLTDQQTGALTIADWEGTSFSTAVMSGILAALLTGDRVAVDPSLPVPENIQEAVYLLKTIATWDADLDGYVLKVSQPGAP